MTWFWPVTCAALAAAAAVPSRPDAALARLRLDRRRAARPERRRAAASTSRPIGRLHGVLALLAGVAAAVVVGGDAGLIAAIPAGLGAGWLLTRLEPAADRHRRRQLVRELPTAVDLLSGCLAAGRPVPDAVTDVGAALGGPLGGLLRDASAWVRLGGDPALAWQRFADEPVLTPLVRALDRVGTSGAPVAQILDGLAADARRIRRREAERAARGVGVSAAAPLGLCFLPSFLLIGVVPTVAGAFAQVLK